MLKKTIIGIIWAAGIYCLVFGDPTQIEGVQSAWIFAAITAAFSIGSALFGGAGEETQAEKEQRKLAEKYKNMEGAATADSMKNFMGGKGDFNWQGLANWGNSAAQYKIDAMASGQWSKVAENQRKQEQEESAAWQNVGYSLANLGGALETAGVFDKGGAPDPYGGVDNALDEIDKLPGSSGNPANWNPSNYQYNIKG